MKINWNRLDVRLKDVPQGDAFAQGGDVFIKTITTTHLSARDGTCYGTNLTNGILTSFGSDEWVEIVEAEMNIL